MKKKEEIFFFFRVNNVKQFKSNLRSMSSKLTTTTQILDVENQPNPLINVAFSQSGLTTLGIQDSLNDAFFSGGQFVDANNLGDPGTINWVQQFKGTNMHGVFLLVSDEDSFLALQLAILKTHFGSSISGQYTLSAKVRPGDQEGHEREPLLYNCKKKAMPDIFQRLRVHGRHQPARNQWFYHESNARPSYARPRSFPSRRDW